MIAIITDPEVGGTFLTWSIYYLSGRTEYFSTRLDKTIELPHNPLTAKNAHNFIPNQPRTSEEIDNWLLTLINKDECMYMHPIVNTDPKKLIAKILNHSKKNIVVAMNTDQVLYKCKYQSRTSKIFENTINYFFKESKQKWDQLQLTDVWDEREFIAINLFPFQHDSILNHIDNTKQYYHINTMDIWTNLDQSVYELFEYLGLSMDTDRYQTWLPIYNQWKTFHINSIKFIWYFETIMHSILNGIDFDLTRFDLDIRQEAAIQHVLMYKHNLNLKTWKLEKFINAKQLHNLLEPNTHDLSKQYNDYYI